MLIGLLRSLTNGVPSENEFCEQKK